MPATLFVVATPIGNLEDMTFRAVRILRSVGLIAAEDTRHTGVLLAHYGIETPTTSFHEHNERQKLPALLDRLRQGTDVALVSDAGTPAVSDPGYRLVRAALDLGCRVEAIPGASAVLAALVSSGLPTDAFTFLGFPPARQKARLAWLQAIAGEPRTLVFFEAPHRIRQTLADALAVLGDRPAAIGRELTKRHEETLHGSLSVLLAALEHPRGEITVVLGPAPSSPAADPPPDAAILGEFRHMTEEQHLGRREAIAALALRYGSTARDIYQAVERAKSADTQPR